MSEYIYIYIYACLMQVDMSLAINSRLILYDGTPEFHLICSFIQFYFIYSVCTAYGMKAL